MRESFIRIKKAYTLNFIDRPSPNFGSLVLFWDSIWNLDSSLTKIHPDDIQFLSVVVSMSVSVYWDISIRNQICRD